MKLKLMTKILLGFSAILVLLVGVAAAGSFGIINQAADYGYVLNKRIPVTTAIMNLDSHIKDEIIQVRGFMIYRDEKMSDKLNELRVTVDKLKKQTAPLLTTEKGKALFTKISDAEETYYVNGIKVIELYRMHQDEEAKPYIDAAVQAINQFNAASEELMALNATLIEENVASAENTTFKAKVITYSVSGFAVLLGLLLAVFFGRSISRPVVSLTKIAGTVAEGDIRVSVPDIKTGDEIQLLGNAFKTMVENLRTMVIQINDTSQAVANTSKDLYSNAEEATKATQQVAHAIEQVAKGATEQSIHVGDTVKVVGQVAQAIEQIASGAHEQSKNVLNTTSMVNEMVNKIDLMAGGIEEVKQTAEHNGAVAEQGGHAVEKTVKGMVQVKEAVFETAKRIQELGDRSQKIGEIIEVIDDIAGQTNLLALNAAIEAARAGEHGKGFAVVADEVRKLAERSGKATKEIAELINDIQRGTTVAVESMQVGTREVEEGVNLAQIAGKSLQDIVHGVKTSRDHVSRITGLIHEILAGSQQVSSAVNNVAAITEENTASTEEMSASAEQVNAAMQNMATVSEESASSAEEVSSSTEELTASIEEISTSSEHLSKMAQDLQNLVSQFRV